MNSRRQGCLQGLLELFLLDSLFKFLESRFGFGRGFSCGGLGCGLIILCVFVLFACNIVSGTNWTSLFGR